MHIDVTPMVRPRSVAVIGASAKRVTQGNVVISNLRNWGYDGRILPIHPQADRIDDLPAVNSVSALREDTDLAIVAIPHCIQVPARREPPLRAGRLARARRAVIRPIIKQPAVTGELIEAIVETIVGIASPTSIVRTVGVA